MNNILEMYEELKGASLTENQARAIIHVVQTCADDRVKELVTNQYFTHEMSLLRKDMSIMKQELLLEIHEATSTLRSEMQADRAELLAKMQAGHAELLAIFQSGHADLFTKIEAGQTNFFRNLGEVRADTLKWMITLLMGGTTIVLGAMYFMFTTFSRH